MIGRWAVVVIATFVVQIGVATDIHLFGVHPELMLLVAICAGLAAGPERGAIIGCIAGVLADVMLPVTLGISALSFAAIGFAVGLAAESMMETTRPIRVGITALASAAGVLLYAALAQLLGQRSLSDPRLWWIVGIVAACNAVLSLPMFALCHWAEGERDGIRLRRGI